MDKFILVIKKWIDSKSYYKLLGAVLGVVLIIPALLHALAYGWSLTGLGIGSIDGWLSFWGSFLGGAMGALGVIATTYFIIEANKEVSNNTAVLNDATERGRIYNELLLNKNEELMHCLSELYELNNSRYNALREYIIIQNNFEKLRDEKSRIFQTKLLSGNLNQSKLTLIKEKHQKNLEREVEVLNIETKVRGQMITLLADLQIKAAFFNEINKDIYTFKNRMSNSLHLFYDFIENERVDNDTIKVSIEQYSEIEKKHFNKIMLKCSNNIENIINNFLK